MSSYICSVKEYVSDNITWGWVALGSTVVGVLMLKNYIRGPRCPSKANMLGKTVVITGANCGIGKATVLELVQKGARVIMACRDVDAGEAAARDIRKSIKSGELVVKHLDLASLDSVKTFCGGITTSEPRIDVLVNNAGVYQCPFTTTEDGFEIQFGVNHLGHFYLTNLLLEKLKSTPSSRVVVVSSGLYKLGEIDFENLNGEKQYRPNRAYYNSKLANCLFSRELAKRLVDSDVSVHCLRPGMVRTNLGRHVIFNPILKALAWLPAWLLIKDSRAGCQTVVYCAVSEDLVGVTGKFYANCRESVWAAAALDDDKATKLWDISKQMTKL